MTDPGTGVDEARPLVVQKYGGTSVATPEGRSALRTRVEKALADGRRVVVVVSAMGRGGEPYATDTLLSLLDGFAPDARERDLLASVGEVVSAVVVAHELRAIGIQAVALTGPEAGVVTDDTFGDATVLFVHAEPLLERLAQGFIPVVAGFQGVTVDGHVATLGRGGSDTTACAIAAALSADEVEIYTDVDGVMTADPRACASARVLSAIEYEELFQMARHGAKVVHPSAAEIAMRADVPVRIRSTFSGMRGTLVSTAERVAGERSADVATAVSNVDGVARFEVLLPEGDGRARAMTRAFGAMSYARVSLDMFTPVGGSLVFSVSQDALSGARNALDGLGLSYTVRERLSRVTLVGSGMHGVPGVMARVASALFEAGVEILQVADSHTTISVLVEQDSSRVAIEALHAAFGLGA